MNHADPSPQFEKVISDVRSARHHQVDIGYTPDHDDAHYTRTLVEVGEKYLHRQGGRDHDSGMFDRDNIVKGIAVLVAAVEAWDRREAR